MAKKAPTLSSLTVTAKGQVTLKKDVLNHLGIEPGEKVVVELLPGGKVELRTDAKKKHSIDDWFGIFHDPNAPVLTIEEMNAIIADGWAGIGEDNGRHESDSQDAAE